MQNKTNKYFIIFGGGGIRGISYCGAFKSLLENNVEVTGCAGSSIGAVFASLLALGYKYEEIFQILSNTGFEMFIDINVGFKKEIALSKGNIFLEWIKEKIEKKFYGDNYIKNSVEPVKFKDINSKLVIYSVNLTDMKFQEFSYKTTPDFEIAKAVRASVSMPGLFTPLEIDEKLIVDGDLLKSTPLWRVSDTIKNLNERILEFRLEDNESSKKISGSIEYLNRVYNAICGFATDYIIDLYREKDNFDYIKIDTPNISVVDFLISKEKKQELFDIGYKTTSKYFKTYLPQKKKFIFEKYKLLLDYILKFQKEFSKMNALNSYLVLSEIFIFLCEEKRYLDNQIYNSIIEFKNVYIENYKTINFFGIKTALASNKEQISKLLLEILDKITNKLEEYKE